MPCADGYAMVEFLGGVVWAIAVRIAGVFVSPWAWAALFVAFAIVIIEFG